MCCRRLRVMGVARRLRADGPGTDTGTSLDHLELADGFQREPKPPYYQDRTSEQVNLVTGIDADAAERRRWVRAAKTPTSSCSATGRRQVNHYPARSTKRSPFAGRGLEVQEDLQAMALSRSCSPPPLSSSDQAQGVRRAAQTPEDLLSSSARTRHRDRLVRAESQSLQEPNAHRGEPRRLSQMAHSTGAGDNALGGRARCYGHPPAGLREAGQVTRSGSATNPITVWRVVSGGRLTRSRRRPHPEPVQRGV